VFRNPETDEAAGDTAGRSAGAGRCNARDDRAEHPAGDPAGGDAIDRLIAAFDAEMLALLTFAHHDADIGLSDAARNDLADGAICGQLLLEHGKNLFGRQKLLGSRIGRIGSGRPAAARGALLVNNARRHSFPARPGSNRMPRLAEAQDFRRRRRRLDIDRECHRDITLASQD